MIGRIEQIFQHDQVSAAAGVLNQNQYSATTWASDRSKFIPWEGEDVLMIVKTDAAPTGTTPGFTPTLQLSTNGGAYANVAAGVQITTATTQVTFFSGPTIAAYANTNTYFLRVLLTSGAGDNVETGMSIHLAFLY